MRKSHIVISKIMRKSHIILLFSVLLLGSCGKGNESHYTTILYPSTHYRIVMADQTSDSLVVSSTDTWNLSNSAPDWCHYPSEYSRFVNKYSNTWIEVSIPLTFDVNTTGKVRSVLLSLDADESSNAAYYAQVPFLGISRPMRVVSNDLTEQKIYPLELIASSTLDSVSFSVYADWTLVPLNGNWLTPAATQGKAGENLVNLTVTPNTSVSDRSDTLLLRSNGVQDTIFVIQRGTNPEQ